jgi:hypothetical protein
MARSRSLSNTCTRAAAIGDVDVALGVRGDAAACSSGLFVAARRQRFQNRPFAHFTTRS